MCIARVRDTRGGKKYCRRGFTTGRDVITSVLSRTLSRYPRFFTSVASQKYGMSLLLFAKNDTCLLPDGSTGRRSRRDGRGDSARIRQKKGSTKGFLMDAGHPAGDLIRQTSKAGLLFRIRRAAADEGTARESNAAA